MPVSSIGYDIGLNQFTYLSPLTETGFVAVTVTLTLVLEQFWLFEVTFRNEEFL